MATENISSFAVWGELSLTVGDRQDSDRSEYFLQISLFSQLMTTLDHGVWLSSPPRSRILKEVRVVIRLVPHETGAILAHVLCTPYNHNLNYVALKRVREADCNPEYWNISIKEENTKKGYGFRCLSLPCMWVWLLPKKRQPSIEKARL